MFVGFKFGSLGGQVGVNGTHTRPAAHAELGCIVDRRRCRDATVSPCLVRVYLREIGSEKRIRS